jgi:hypothetical protein
MKFYLAGYETACKNYDIYFPKDYNVFCTYFYKTKTIYTLKELKKRRHTGLITIDSGAHSFFQQVGMAVTKNKKIITEKKLTVVDAKKYFEEYFQFIKEYYDYFSYYVELDIQELVGLPLIYEWRERLKKAGLFKKCITVYHKADGDNEFKKLLKESESKYIALEGIRQGVESLNYLSLIKQCYEKNIKVHGFAMTNFEVASRLPFYSVDSSSWVATIRYGTFAIIDKKGVLKQVKITRNNCFKYNIPIGLMNHSRTVADCQNKLYYTAKQYYLIAKYFTELWEKRGIKWKD